MANLKATVEHRTPALRPRAASTLIILKRDGGTHKVLMGKRHENHRFMPGKFVFPGGRVDFADSRIRPASDLSPAIIRSLMKRGTAPASPGRARAMALAAIRETFEETGISLGRPLDHGPMRSKSGAWQAYFDTGVVPDLKPLSFIARAITPPGRPRRYDTRFFLTHAEDWDTVDFTASISNELTEVHWLSLSDARELDLPRVTGFVLESLERAIAATGGVPKTKTVPFFYHRGSNWVHDRL